MPASATGRLLLKLKLKLKLVMPSMAPTAEPHVLNQVGSPQGPGSCTEKLLTSNRSLSRPPIPTT
jgi:hypothetical protein